MWKWLQQIFKKKENKKCCNISFEERKCQTCVWWAAEEENNAPSANEVDSRFDENYRLCDIHKKYSHKIHFCNHYLKEEFEATADSIQTEELELKHEMSIEKSEKNDTEGKR